MKDTQRSTEEFHVGHKYITKNFVSRVPLTRSQARSSSTTDNSSYSKDTNGFESILEAVEDEFDQLEYTTSTPFGLDNGTDEEEDHFDIKEDEMDMPSNAVNTIISAFQMEDPDEEVNIEDDNDDESSDSTLKRNSSHNSNSDIDVTTVSDEDDNNLQILREQSASQPQFQPRSSTIKQSHKKPTKKNHKKKRKEKSRSTSPKRTKQPNQATSEYSEHILHDHDQEEGVEKQLPLKKRKWHTELEIAAAMVLGDQHHIGTSASTSSVNASSNMENKMFDAGFALVKLQEATQ